MDVAGTAAQIITLNDHIYKNQGIRNIILIVNIKLNNNNIKHKILMYVCVLITQSTIYGNTIQRCNT